MKVLHIIYSFRTGGSENLLVDILNRQQLLGLDVELFIINKDYDLALIEKINKSIKVTCFNRVRGGKDPLPIIRLNRFLLKSKPDVLHFHDQLGAKVVFCGKQPKVLTIHTLEDSYPCLSKYDVLCAVSSAVKSHIYERTGLTSQLIYNGIDMKSIVHQRRGIKKQINEPFRMLQVSRLYHKVKGQDVLIKALHYLKRSDITIDFIGEGESFGYLEQMRSDLGLEKQINFLGLKNREYVYENIHNYDLLVQPSIFEGFGLTVAEGIAAKIPVLVSDNDGPMEIIDNGNYGFFFEKGNVEDCAKQIERIVAMPSTLIEEKIDKAYEYTQANFDIEKTVDAYLKEYKKLLNK